MTIATIDCSVTVVLVGYPTDIHEIAGVTSNPRGQLALIEYPPYVAINKAQHVL